MKPILKDYMNLIMIYLISCCSILLIIPIGVEWGIVTVIMLVFAGVLQRFFDKHLKPLQ